jgi:Fe2+ transport system protein FeoA
MTAGQWLQIGLIILAAMGTALFAFANLPIRSRRFRLRKRTLPVVTDSRVSELIATGLLPLAECPRDHKACLRCLEIDRCLLHRLSELGMTPGVELRVVHDAGGPMLLSVRGSRVALGRDLAEKIWVEIISPEQNTATEPAAGS